MTEEQAVVVPAEKKKVGTHLCSRCEKKIECTSKDPVNMTSEGVFHNACMKEHYQLMRGAEAKKEADAAAKKKKPAKKKKE